MRQEIVVKTLEEKPYLMDFLKEAKTWTKEQREFALRLLENLSKTKENKIDLNIKM